MRFREPVKRFTLQPTIQVWKVSLMMNSRKILKRTILEVVENQLHPPETKETFDRLVSEGVSKSEARRLISCVVTSEIFDILKYEQPYDEERYVKALRRLPELPE